MFVFRIIRLTLIAFMITYFIGCLWWMLVNMINTTKDRKSGHTFSYKFGFDQYYTFESPEICKYDSCMEHIKEGG